MQDSLFKTLKPEEVPEFQAYAHDNWTPNTAPELIWHPEVRKAWRTMDVIANAVANVYEVCAPKIKAMPSNVDADIAVETVADAFTTHADPEECDLWFCLPHKVRNRIVHQIVGGYY
tara:strand:+ start:209 stop:559 length:351 start_codon:yes stop_codon:yes gene_type:complete